MPSRWPKHLEEKLTNLVRSGRHTYVEIAPMMKMTVNQVRVKGLKLGLVNPTFLNRITKTKNIRDQAFKYYVKHGFTKAQNHFKLTKSELRAVLTVSYKNPKLKNLRRDKRTRRPWSFEETIFLIQHMGLKNRRWIAKKTKRSKTSYHTVKEQLSRLGIKNKHFHGLPLGHTDSIFQFSLREHAIKTAAGPASTTHSFEFKIIPWVTLERLSKKHKLDPFWQKSFAAQAKLQRWFFKLKSEKAVVRKIKTICQEA